MMGRKIEIEAPDGSGLFACYLAEPAASGTQPTIIVLQEIFGVNAGIRKVCDRFAAAGYTAIAPDLFWRIEPNVELDPASPGDRERAFALRKSLDDDLTVKDIEAVIHHVRAKAGPDAKVGCTGYCLGGRLAFMAACRTDIDAAVGYYGVGIDRLLDEANAIANPVLLHIAAEDGFVDKRAQAKMHQVLDPHPKVTLFDYPGCDHAFAREAGPSRVEAAAQLADQRTMAFFETNLG